MGGYVKSSQKNSFLRRKIKNITLYNLCAILLFTLVMPNQVIALSAANQKIQPIESLNRVTLTGYRQKDFTEWSGKNLEHITIDRSETLESLKGIQTMERLKLVELNNCPRFKRPTLYKNDYPFLRIYIDGEMQE